jgi:ABC-type nitrate/sulfonate/bicarbonate transport system substrate-binding protein
MTVSSPPEIDTLWYTRCPVPTATGVALETGLLTAEFAPDGVAVRSLRAAPDPAVRESHFTHTLAASFREGGNVPALHARSSGQATRLIALTWVEEFQSLLTPPDSGIITPEHLRGRRVLVPGHGGDRVDFDRAMALRGLDATLALAGLTREDVVLVDVPTDVGDLVERDGAYRHDHYGRELAALRAGLGDAFYAKGAPAVDTLRAHWLRTVADLTRSGDVTARINNGTPRTVTVSEHLLEARPDLVTRYLAALIRAGRWAGDHATRTREILAAETGASVASTAVAYGEDVHTRLRFGLSAETVAALTFQKDFLLREGFLEADVDIASWVAAEPLAEAQSREHPSRSHHDALENGADPS